MARTPLRPTLVANSAAEAMTAPQSTKSPIVMTDRRPRAYAAPTRSHATDDRGGARFAVVRAVTGKER